VRTFAQTPKASTVIRPNQATSASANRENALLPHSQRTKGNQAEQRQGQLRPQAEEPEAGLTVALSPRLGHDFGGIDLHFPAAGVIQTKLAINQPGDEYEQEADRVSEQVMRMPEPQIRRSCPCGGGCPKCHERLQMKGVGSSGLGRTEVPPIVYEVLRSPGQPLDAETRAFMEPRFGYDFSPVRVHADQLSARSAEALAAQAYTVGFDVVFGSGRHANATRDRQRLLAHELAHVVQGAHATTGATAGKIRRKEVDGVSAIRGPQDWIEADRENSAKRWHDACLVNLNAADSSQYVRVVERRDFYKWFYDYAGSLGYNTRWALAAYVVANGAHQIVDMDVSHSVSNEVFDLANVELQGAMREGNQVIFDNALPKLKKLIDGGPLTGPAALKWDMQILAEEQNLVQSMYSRLSKETVEQLNSIARKKGVAGVGAWITQGDKVEGDLRIKGGKVPAFDQPDIKNVGDRWKYGMELGNTFTPGGSGFNPAKDAIPAVGAGYQDGSEFARVDVRSHLHELDAFLNPNRVSRTGPGSDITPIIASLTESEKKLIVADKSADGWAYSIQFAQFCFVISEAVVKTALPSDLLFAKAIQRFLARYKTECDRVRAVIQELSRVHGPKY
jgi:hypothetical protein